MDTILVVEDDRNIRSLLSFALTRAGYSVIEAETAKQAWSELAKMTPSLILMDWGLPDSTGIEILKQLKNNENTVSIPIIMLTAKTEKRYRIHGLNAGAEDYICKPFSPLELIARIRAVLRRNHLDIENNDNIDNDNKQDIQVKDMILDRERQLLTINNQEICLGATEFRLLQCMMEKPEHALSRESLLNNASKKAKYVEDRTIDVHIHKLRRVLSPWGYHRAIKTVRSIGYRFSAKAIESLSPETRSSPP